MRPGFHAVSIACLIATSTSPPAQAQGQTTIEQDHTMPIGDLHRPSAPDSGWPGAIDAARSGRNLRYEAPGRRTIVATPRVSPTHAGAALSLRW
jgi:hypothetical protein